MSKISEMENLFLALGDKTRLRLLNLIADGAEVSVCRLAEALQEAQPKISRHLAYLRRMNLVQTRREGKLIYYRLTVLKSQSVKRIFEELVNEIANDKLIELDCRRFSKIDEQDGNREISANQIGSNIFRVQEKVSPLIGDAKPQKEVLADFLL